MSLLTKASMVMTPNAIKESKVYSIIPSNGNGDLDFTRGTLASSTLTSASGLIETVPYNLLLQSEQFNDSIWFKQNLLVTTNASNSPNGTSTADKLIPNISLNQHRIFENNNLNGEGVFSVYAKADGYNFLSLGQGGIVLGSSIIFNLANGTFSGVASGFTPTIESVGSGWYRCSIYSTTLGNGTTAGYFIIVRNANSVSDYIGDGVSGVLTWGAQVVQGSIPKDYFFTTDRLNVPRLNYESYGGCPSILLEPQRTNLFLNSVWAGGGTTPTSWVAGLQTGTSTPIASIKNPNVTAYRFVTTSAQRQEFYQQFAFTSTPTNSITCFSVYVESVTTAVAIFEMLRVTPTTTGVGTPIYLKNNVAISGNANIEAGNTYSIQYTVTASDVFRFRIGSGVNNTVAGNFVISMPQVEQGAATPTPIAAYPTSYIPTTTSAVTRNADTFTRNNIYTNGLITSAGGTWFIELNNVLNVTRDIPSQSLFIATFANGQGEGLTIRSFPNILVIQAVVNSANGAILYTLGVGTSKIAIKWNGATADVFVNGVKVSTNVTFPYKNMEFLGGNGGDVPKYIKSTMLFSSPLTDTECINLTQ